MIMWTPSHLFNLFLCGYVAGIFSCGLIWWHLRKNK